MNNVSNTLLDVAMRIKDMREILGIPVEEMAQKKRIQPSKNILHTKKERLTFPLLLFISARSLSELSLRTSLRGIALTFPPTP